MTIFCPKCFQPNDGGMTLVRHLHDAHQISYDDANKIVDHIYIEIAGRHDMTIEQTPYNMTVQYQHLNADTCEKLKEQVQDKEKEYYWGTHGPKRDEELQEYSIDKLSTQHLENILITQPQIGNELAAAILMLLKKRYGAL